LLFASADSLIGTGIPTAEPDLAVVDRSRQPGSTKFEKLPHFFIYLKMAASYSA
jgi:hypothetical protein